MTVFGHSATGAFLRSSYLSTPLEKQPMKLAMVLLFAIALVGCGGYGNKSNTPPQPGAVPTISNLNTPSVVAGSGQFSLVVTGTSFTTNAVIIVNVSAH